MNTLKEWVLGVALLAATPFLMFFAILAMGFIKMPIMIYTLYKEFWEDFKEERK